MALIARLISYASAAFGSGRASQEPGLEDGDDEHLAATALLVHVARADGVLDAAESERLVRLVRTRYAATDAEARDLIARASAFDAETRDLSDLVELIGREGGEDERGRILAMAWSVAGADGQLHEFEEALVWRLGKLLGLDEAGIAQARDAARAAGEPSPKDGREPDSASP